MRVRHHSGLLPLALVLASITTCLGAALAYRGGTTLSAQSHAADRPSTGTDRTFRVTVRKYAYTPARIEVSEGDLVRLELHTDDIAHSLTIDGYRLSRRIDAGHDSLLEFRADQAGTFPFYCNLQIDDGCRKMRGELVVRKRK